MVVDGFRSFHVLVTTLNCLASPRLASPCLVLPCLALPFLALPYPTVPCLALPGLVMPRLTLSYPIGFFTDHSGNHSMFWYNDTVFPVIPEGFSWPSASSKTVLLPSKKLSTFIVALTQPSLTPTKTGSSTFPIASFPTTKELSVAATAVYTSSVADVTSNQVTQFATDINHYPSATKFPTGKNPCDDQV